MKDQALYLEVDEDITSAIDKLQKLAGDTAQVVVPKRSTMLQSVINLKLLKKAAADAGKELVLVTNDRVATDLASRLGLAVAPSLGAKPVLTEAEEVAPLDTEDVIEAEDEPEAVGVDAAVASAEKAAKPTGGKRPLFARKAVDDDPIAMPSAAALASHDLAADAVAKPPKVPNMNVLQKRLAWVGLAVALIVGYFVAMYVFASANVTLYATGSQINVSLAFKADPSLSKSDIDNRNLAAQTVTYSKDESVSFTATGTKDAGTKASGTITVSNCTTNPQLLVAGTRFVAPDGKVFRSGADATVPAGAYPLGSCVPGKATIAVTADANGDSYNEAPAAYTIPALNIAAVTAQGGQMSGGTTKTLTVVSQADIDKAKTDTLAKDADDAKRSLTAKVPSGYLALDGSSQQTSANVVSAPALDAEAATATLTFKATYTQLAVLNDDVKAMLRAEEQQQIGANHQIYDDGLDGVKVVAGNRETTGRQPFTLTTAASGGEKIDKTALANQIAGKRYGDAVELAKQQPSVQRADIGLSPPWSTKLPRASKIHVDIQVAEAKTN